MYKLLKGSVFFAFVVALAPSITFAQSLEWLAENRGVLPHAVAEAILAPVNVRTNDGLEQKVRSFSQTTRLWRRLRDANLDLGSSTMRVSRSMAEPVR
jgi:hypothetical protein